MGSTLHLRLLVPLTAEHVRRLCAGLGEQLTAGTVSAVVCTVDRAGDEPSGLADLRGLGDLATVDAVARLALVARRAGVTFRLDSPGSELAALLGLVGLRTVLAGLPDDP